MKQTLFEQAKICQIWACSLMYLGFAEYLCVDFIMTGERKPWWTSFNPRRRYSSWRNTLSSSRNGKICVSKLKFQITSPSNFLNSVIPQNNNHILSHFRRFHRQWLWRDHPQVPWICKSQLHPQITSPTNHQSHQHPTVPAVPAYRSFWKDPRRPLSALLASSSSRPRKATLLIASPRSTTAQYIRPFFVEPLPSILQGPGSRTLQQQICLWNWNLQIPSPSNF